MADTLDDLGTFPPPPARVPAPGGTRRHQKPHRVAVRLDTGRFNDWVYRGIIRYAWEHHWNLTLNIRDSGPEHVKLYSHDAVIGNFNDLRTLEGYLALGVPLVQVLGLLDHPQVPSVAVDHAECGRVAARHLLDRGFEHFGFIGYDADTSEERRRGFADGIAGRAKSFTTCHVPFYDSPESVAATAAWLHALPVPAAVFAHDDRVAMNVINIAHMEDIRIPTRLAVVGVNDDWMCAVTRPELSSVAIPWDEMGYRAAWTMDRLLRQKPVTTHRTVLPPTGLTVRGSSDVSSLSDPGVSEAASFIRDHFHENISVADVLEAVPVGRRSLERRFKSLVGRTLLDEINHVRLERATRLLREGNLRVSDIARASGFGSRSQFIRTFRAAQQMTPDEYRKRWTKPAGGA